MTPTDAQLWRGNRAATRQRAAALQRAQSMVGRYKAEPWLLPPQELQKQLKDILAEIDPYDVRSALDLQTWDIIGGATGDLGLERERAVKASKWLFKCNPLAQWAIWLWTSWGMGDKVRVSVIDKKTDKSVGKKTRSPSVQLANTAVDEFFTAERNEPVLADDNIKELSRWLLVGGNRFFVFFTSTVDGITTVDLIDQDEMKPIKNPDRKKVVWFYKRTWTPEGKTSKTMYYPDYKTYFAERDTSTLNIDQRWQHLVELETVREDAKKSWGDGDNIGDGETTPSTDAYILWSRHNIKDEDELWGWPLLTNPRAWLQAHQHLLESRLTLAEAATQYFQRMEVEGGSRAVKSVIGTIKSNLSQNQRYDTNPPATAGSTQVQNKAVTTTDLPLITGASDTATDNKTFVWMALLGAGIFPTSAGLDAARFATALEMDKAQSMLFEEYKSFWGAQFKKIAKIALLALEKHSNANFGDYTIVVSIDTFSLADFPAIAKTIGGFVRDTITPLVEADVVDRDPVMAIITRFYKMALDSLGVEDAADLTSDEAFGIGVEREEPPEPAPVVVPVVPGAEMPMSAEERILENLRDGNITPEIVREWMIGELGDMAG